MDVCIQKAVADYGETVARAAFTYLKNVHDAEDIAQEVFLVLLQKEPRIENEAHLKAWLLRVAANKCKNYLKSGWNRSREPLPDNLEYLEEKESQVLSAVLSLEIKYRVPIYLYYYEGYSMKEIAGILYSRSATIGTRLARGREQLGRILREEWEHE
ncbi:sigma-70 family RNA polymerase sigma factor [Anaerovorax odorimutans]|uniref:Sigma-70 family RNA polymerase sigma factor n=1 Tax=Anaerovorax odorimutans TaxID=109327 RepID=A0ABT1RPJ5_9FIRM|nr:sigma-70 family RNA polymerase sigma factor [Anaerovorax odorimutans]MCQ4637089.1 sigma-70 family RNA polymerase sigma factor [Anaerovorax odorimutans]